ASSGIEDFTRMHEMEGVEHRWRWTVKDETGPLRSLSTHLQKVASYLANLCATLAKGGTRAGRARMRTSSGCSSRRSGDSRQDAQAHGVLVTACPRELARRWRGCYPRGIFQPLSTRRDRSTWAASIIESTMFW